MKKRDSYFKRKTILITGGTGSFGTTVVSSLLTYSPAQIIIFSRDEKKQFDMRNQYTDPRLRFIVGDVRDTERVSHLFMRMNIDYVFHAAALKQVPSCEFFPMEAVKTNILGAENILTAALESSVERVVILSTDKAAYPINAMGMTKALMEKLMIGHARSLDHEVQHTILSGVRYGNVLYSRGSVIPFFIDQMKKGVKLPVTHREMTRFLLPLPHAVDLVLFAMTEGKNGHMYVKKAPSCTLAILAEALCRLFNYKKGWKEVGIRSGEKMHETLVTSEEMMRARDLTNYYEIAPEAQGLDYDMYFKNAGVKSADDIKPYTSGNTKRLSVDETVALLKTLPEIQNELASVN